MVDISSLKTEITSLLTTELHNEDGFDADLLESKVALAIKDVMGRREYGNSHYTDEKILEELSTRYFTTITNLARYDYNQRLRARKIILKIPCQGLGMTETNY